jgi:hypothetical protein
MPRDIPPPIPGIIDDARHTAIFVADHLRLVREVIRILVESGTMPSDFELDLSVLGPLLERLLMTPTGVPCGVPQPGPPQPKWTECWLFDPPITTEAVTISDLERLIDRALECLVALGHVLGEPLVD